MVDKEALNDNYFKTSGAFCIIGMLGLFPMTLVGCSCLVLFIVFGRDITRIRNTELNEIPIKVIRIKRLESVMVSVIHIEYVYDYDNYHNLSHVYVIYP